MSYRVAALGGGRMGRGIALSFALAGSEVVIVDLKPRAPAERRSYADASIEELRTELNFLKELGLINASAPERVLAAVSFIRPGAEGEALKHIDAVFEGVPELLEVKAEAFAYICAHVSDTTLIASTTSTILVDELAAMVSRPQRFMNAHWLNPAHLMPLVEISRGAGTGEADIDAMKALLEAVGKVPVVCSASAGYIVPRLQALAMNEASRMVEEGVAAAEDIDRAVKVGFGPRFTVLGLLEFIDWGGGDILYYASEYLSKAIDPRFETSDIVKANMADGRNGLREGEGFYDYRSMDVAAYRGRRMRDFVDTLRHRRLLPALAPEFRDKG